MTRLDTFTLEVHTGANRGPERFRYSINGFELDFEECEGGTDAGECLKLSASPQSFPHSLALRGPDEGTWDIESVVAVYHCMGEPPYTIRLGAVELDHESDLNIWHEKPQPVFEV